METVKSSTSDRVEFCLTCDPTVEHVYSRCGFERTAPLNPTSPEQSVPARDPAQVAATKAALLAHLDRTGGGAPCCTERALHCKVCALHTLIVAEAATLLRAAEEDLALFPVRLNIDNRPKLFASSGELWLHASY